MAWRMAPRPQCIGFGVGGTTDHGGCAFSPLKAPIYNTQGTTRGSGRASVGVGGFGVSGTGGVGPWAAVSYARVASCDVRVGRGPRGGGAGRRSEQRATSNEQAAQQQQRAARVTTCVGTCVGYVLCVLLTAYCLLLLAWWVMRDACFRDARPTQTTLRLGTGSGACPPPPPPPPTPAAGSTPLEAHRWPFWAFDQLHLSRQNATPPLPGAFPAVLR
jgi:hypothetical protein